MGEETAAKFAGVFAGDMVKAKKPAPDVYNLAVERLALDPSNCVVVEDSRNGLLASAAAGMNTIVTYNQLTQDEDFSEAEIVVSSLGDPDSEETVVSENRSNADPQGYVRVDDLEAILAGGRE